MLTFTRRRLLQGMGKVAALAQFVNPFSERLLTASSLAAEPASISTNPERLNSIEDLRSGWNSPNRSYRSHTRWWWPGSAATEEGISWELDQMSQQSMGGVEIMSPWRMYTKGNHEYLTPEYLRLVKYAIQQAKQRDMEVSLTFGAGWSFGGFWVPPTQRSKVLTRSWEDISGPSTYNKTLPAYVRGASFRHGSATGRGPEFVSEAPDENQIVAVVAARLEGDSLDAGSLIDLTPLVQHDALNWRVPEGQWKLMVFRLKYTGQMNSATDSTPKQQWVVDHFSKEAMTAYCEYLGGIFQNAFGDEFGKTLGTFFCDSFEISVLPDSIHWSNAALAQFHEIKGYDLTRYLPAIWWDIGDLTPKVRYDVNDFLAWLGMDATFKTFTEWCARHNMEAKVQPHYRFTEELIQGAGSVQRPEMEVTTARFAVVPDPRKAIAAGGHFYGRRIISAESYTFLHQQRYRTKLEEMKIATDAFLRDGVTQFYNHGYLYSPEMHVAPSRDVPWANRISHWNTWWKYYHHLTAYIARCCFLLRQGEFAGDVLIYSPQATVWTQKVVFNDDRRVMPYGDVGQILVASGYDFDPVNDDVLQNRARVEDGHVVVGDLAYRFLILPRTTAVPAATLEFIRKFALGGGIVIALDELPSTGVGLKDHATSDVRTRQIVEELFGLERTGKAHAGGGRTHFIPDYKIPNFDETGKSFNPMASQPLTVQTHRTPAQEKLLSILGESLAPDFGLEGNRLSTGLTFIHRRLGQDDIYFVTNLQDTAVATTITFRAPGKIPQFWDPMTGSISQTFTYRTHAKGVDIPVELSPFGSVFVVFRPGSAQLHTLDSNLDRITRLSASEVEGITARSGETQVEVTDGKQSRAGKTNIVGIPVPFELKSDWKLSLEGYRFNKVERRLGALKSWTEDPSTAYFSGTGRYSTTFELTADYVSPDLELTLDLGKVGDVAEVHVNDSPESVVWMQPYTIDVTHSVKAGVNHLQILVTNTLINYVSGLSELPEVPEDLRAHYGTTAESYRLGQSTWEHREKDFHPLPMSGLLGPVRIIARRKVTVQIAPVV